MRWGLGPVFIYECLTNSRRWQTFALRSLGVGALLVAMATIASSNAPPPMNSWRYYASMGQEYFFAMIGMELALVMLAAPAATAGAICLDRARGTLAHMLMTELSDAEIVLGKLAARLLPVFGLVACTWPVMAISSLLGGIDPIALTLAFAIIVAVAVFGCTTALAISVWAKKSHEVVLATYTIFILGLLLWPIWFFISMRWRAVGPPPQWTLLANPFYMAFAPYGNPANLGSEDYLIFFGAALLASALFTGLAVWRTRPVTCRGSDAKSTGPRIGVIGRLTRLLPGPSLDRNPVLWRERHRSRHSVWMTAVVILLMGTTGALCITGAGAFWKHGVAIGPTGAWEVAGLCALVLHVIFGLLMLAAIAPTSMAEERQRGSLDLLAATTLSTRAIVFGKWLGTFRLVFLMTICPALMAFAMATARGQGSTVGARGMPPNFFQSIPLGVRIAAVFLLIATILAHGALLTSIGVALGIRMKRQSRAIAFSVAFFLLVTAVWPIVTTVIFRTGPDFGRGLACFSPVAVAVILVRFCMDRFVGYSRGGLWPSAFWAAEVFTLALGLLWLGIRSFENCFDRMPDRPRQTSLPAAAVIILAGLIGAGSFVAGIESWVEGVRPATLNAESSIGSFGYAILIAIGIVLVAVDAAKSGRPTRTSRPQLTPTLEAWAPDGRQWWKSFRLILLLAIGPAFIALALATASHPAHYEPRYATNASGVGVITTYVKVRSDVPMVGEIPLGQRLVIALVWMLTILAHGAAATGVGLLLANVKEWSKRTVATVIGLLLVVIVILPFYTLVIFSGHDASITMWSVVSASNSLFAALSSRMSFDHPDTLRSLVFCDVVVSLIAFGLWSRVVWLRQHRLRGDSEAKTAGRPEPKFSIEVHDG
jgi:hypothetical protein